MATPADSAAKQRLEILLKQLPKIEGDLIEGSAIDKIVQVDRKGGDSLHRLVMDLHKQLNALQRGLAEEQIDGAATYNLGPGDDALIRALMAGLASFWRMPPDNFFAIRLENGARPVLHRSSEIIASRLARDCPNRRPKNSMFSRTLRSA
jgi:hypothetical protein